MKLHSYFSSSASFRVRIALALKGLPYEYQPVDLLKGEQLGTAFAAVSSAGLVPALETDEGDVLVQSLAIMEYLDEIHPEPSLLPGTAIDRARIRALAQAVACEIHPLNNLRVLRYLAREIKADQEARDTWYRHWVRLGLEAFERELARSPAGPFCYGSTPTLADCCLVPQIFNAQRLRTTLSGLSRTMAAFEACMALPAFQQAQPSACPDNEGCNPLGPPRTPGLPPATSIFMRSPGA